MGIDKNGNVFLTGYTFSSDFPTFNPGNDVYFQQNCAGHYDAFIVKLNNIGICKWATYYGGYEHDIGTSIVTDTSGAVFLTGYTASTDFPTLNPGGETYFQATHSGGNWDLFILKFTNAGVRKWATYYGGNGWDQSSAIKTDIFDNIFLTGVTYSTNFPLCNPGGSAYFQNAFAGERDAFIIKFSNAGVLQWSTYYGGTNKDFGTSVVSDNSGNVFVTGATWSTNFPVYNPGGQTYYQTYKYDWDAFVLKFDNNGARLWATYYGGYEADAGNSIITDKQGNVYITGNTWSEEFPVQNPGEGGYFKSALTSLNIPDIFILKFTNTGVRKWATYYGGTGHDDAFCVSVDRIGNIFITGETHSTDFTTYNPGGNVYFQGNSSGNCESYILKFESSIFLSCEKKQGTRPQKYILYQNFPNPFNNETVIRFELPNAEFLKLKIFNSIGKEIKTLLCEELSSGVYDVKFHADGLPSGIYFYQIESSNYKEVRKMILVK
ncbi:MAG: SBBP repeat-containing protein [Ignavibacteria bacterium]|nr:SBBP repeat-containing protein [Ignavibacteria bacterium]